MTTRWLALRLIVPLLAIAVALAALHARYPAGGAFVNLATEFVGIIVTVFYVEWIIRLHERKDWERAESKIRTKIRHTANAAITAIRSPLGIEIPVVDRGKGVIRDSAYYQMARDMIIPSLPDRIEALESKQWNALVTGLEQTSQRLDQLLSTFGGKLTGFQYETALEVQEGVARIALPYRAVPESYGSDRPVRSPADVALHRFNVDSTTADLVALLSHLCLLGESARDQERVSM